MPDPLLFGSGWASVYDLDLEQTDERSVSLRGSDGGYVQFAKKADGSWVPAIRTGQTLTRTADGWTLTDDGSGAGYRFDDTGRLAAQFDPQGHELALGYTGDTLATISDAAGRTATVTTNGAGRITRIDLPDGRYNAYTYTAAGYLSSVRDLAGTTLSYKVDRRGRITNVHSADGVLLRNVYDADGRVVAQYDALARPTFMAYDDGSLNRIAIAADGGVRITCYNGAGLPTGEVDPLGGVTTRLFDRHGNVRSLLDPAGARSTFRYDDRDHPVEVTAADDHTVSLTYDTSGHPLTVDDGAGTTTTSYTAGLPTSVTRADGSHSLVVATYVLDPATRLPTSITTPGNATTQVYYDGRGYPDSVTDAEGRKTRLRGGRAGHVTADHLAQRDMRSARTR